MAHQAFYRKWRPKTFDGVFGQTFITRTLKNEVAGGKLSHAYLFCGSRGTGKTTCAKILAKAVNCEHPEDGNPCLKCDACRAIDQEAAIDVVEMDAASNTGVDDVRALRESAAYSPAACRYRVYIIDEVHMLSKSAFNALLKILEEPPAHVIFILATTDPEAIPVTVLSRCQRFDFKRLTEEEIIACLQKVCEREKLTLEDPAARLIAHLADGGMRDALSILDQCAGISDQITEELTAEVTRSAGRGPIEELAEALAKKDISRCLSLLDGLHRESKNLLHITRELISLFRLAMLAQVDPSCSSLRETLADEQKTAAALAALLPQQEVFTGLEELQNCYVRQCHADDQKLELEMSLIRLTDPRQRTDTQRLLARLEQLERAAADGVPLVSAAPQPAFAPAPPAAPAAPKKTVQQTLNLPDEAPAAPKAQEKPAAPVNTCSFVQAEFIEELSRKLPMIGAVLGCTEMTCDGRFLTVNTAGSPMAEGMLAQENNKKGVEQVASGYVGAPITLRLQRQKPDSQKEEKADRLSRCMKLAAAEGIIIENE